jgi:hypothetical protein
VKIIPFAGGIYSRIVGIRAIKARVIVAIAANLPPSYGLWKKMSKLIVPKIQSGINTVVRVERGCL